VADSVSFFSTSFGFISSCPLFLGPPFSFFPYSLMISAATPTACGDAIDVPW